MVKAVVGANWGDEGKGKITDMLGETSDIIVRFQGGANAGHTIINDYGKFALHTLPSGVFYNHTTSVIGNGVALNIPVLFKEIEGIVSQGVPQPKILVSDRAQMVMPYHILFDQYEEERLGKNSFGSTKSGIAPFYSDKYAKIGFQVSELFDDDSLKEKIKAVCEKKNVLLEHLYHKPLLDPDELYNTLMAFLPLPSLAVAVIVTVFPPIFFFVVTTPLLLTVATLVLLDFHVTPLLYALDGVTIAFNVTFLPVAILLDVVVVIVILLTLIFSTVTMQYITFPSDVIAVIIAFPAALAVNLPAASTVTTASLEDVHFTVPIEAVA